MLKPTNIWASRLAELALVQKDSNLPNSPEADFLNPILSQLKNVRKYCVDTAASNGVHSSTTYPFLKQGWDGLAVEMHPGKFSALSYIYQDLKNVGLTRQKITPLNIVSILECHEVPRNFGLWNMDIDSYDLFVVKAALDSGYRPTVISIEINEKIPHSVYFTVLFNQSHYWRGDHFYGCSLAAAHEEFIPYGYQLVAVHLQNAVFVRVDAEGYNFSETNVKEAFEAGYMHLSDKNILFPWNKDVDYLHELSPEKAINEIDLLFHNYKGLYEIRKSLVN